MKNLIKIISAIIICNLIILTCSVGNTYLQHQLLKDALPVLGYHCVVSDEDKSTVYKDNCYALSVSEFTKQMKYLYDNNYETLSMDEVNDYYHGKRTIASNSVALTFDDGKENFYNIVKPILEQYNFKGTCFVIGSKVNKEYYLKDYMIKNTENVAYYSHSYNLHRYSDYRMIKKLEVASYQEISNDFDECQKVVSCEYFAYPYGISSSKAIDYLNNSKTKLAFSYSNMHNLSSKDNQYYLPRYLIFDKTAFCFFKWIVE